MAHTKIVLKFIKDCKQNFHSHCQNINQSCLKKFTNPNKIPSFEIKEENEEEEEDAVSTFFGKISSTKITLFNCSCF